MMKSLTNGIVLVLLAILAGCGGGGDSAEQVSAPLVNSQPAAVTVAEGQSANLSVVASGTTPLSYQWQRNGVDIAGATSATYGLPSTLVSDNGAAFAVTVSNSVGRITSNSATLSITGASATQTIGSSGGVMTLTSNAVIATLTFPANALVTNTAVTMQSVPPVGSEMARIELQPIGVQFGVPVTIQLQLPASRTIKTSDILGLRIGGQKIFMPTIVDVGARTVTTQVQYFGLRNGVAPSRFVGDGNARKQDSKNEMAVAPGDDGSLTLEELTILQPAAAVVNQALVDLQVEGRFADAAKLQLSIAALVQLSAVPEWQIDAGQMLQGAAITVCAGLAKAIGDAQATPVTGYGDYQSVAKGIVYWASASQALGADACTGTAWSDALHAKLSEALTFVSGNVQTPPAPSGYGPVSMEIRSATILGSEATVLGLPVVAADTRRLYVDPALMPLRVAAFGTSQTSSDQSAYLALLTAFGPTQSLSDDAQYAATTFTVTSKDNVGAAVATKMFGRGTSVGTVVKIGTINARTDGTIEIIGNIAVLHCPNPASERLQILFEGIEVANIGSSGDVLLGINPVLPVLSVSSLLRAAGITAQNATQHRLEIKRINSSCITTFAIYDDVLAAVTLDFAVPVRTQRAWSAASVLPNYTGTGFDAAPVSQGSSGLLNHYEGLTPPRITLSLTGAQFLTGWGQQICPGYFVGSPAWPCNGFRYQVVPSIYNCTATGDVNSSGTMRCTMIGGHICYPTPGSNAQLQVQLTLGTFDASWRSDGTMTATYAWPTFDAGGCQNGTFDVPIPALTRDP